MTWEGTYRPTIEAVGEGTGLTREAACGGADVHAESRPRRSDRVDAVGDRRPAVLAPGVAEPCPAVGVEVESPARAGEDVEDQRLGRHRRGRARRRLLGNDAEGGGRLGVGPAEGGEVGVAIRIAVHQEDDFGSEKGHCVPCRPGRAERRRFDGIGQCIPA